MERSDMREIKLHNFILSLVGQIPILYCERKRDLYNMNRLPDDEIAPSKNHQRC